MVTLFVKHTVGDYNTWKQGYDAFGPTRQTLGVVGASVHRDLDNPNVVTITHEFNDLDTGTSFVNSDELRKTMMNAGVIGQPEIWFAEDVERTDF